VILFIQDFYEPKVTLAVRSNKTSASHFGSRSKPNYFGDNKPRELTRRRTVGSTIINEHLTPSSLRTIVQFASAARLVGLIMEFCAKSSNLSCDHLFFIRKSKSRSKTAFYIQDDFLGAGVPMNSELAFANITTTQIKLLRSGRRLKSVTSNKEKCVNKPIQLIIHTQA